MGRNRPALCRAQHKNQTRATCAHVAKLPPNLGCLAGAYPASLDDYETERILTTLLELGVNTFVCLQAEFALHTPESSWRAGQGLRPYIKDAQRILIRARETQSTRIKQVSLGGSLPVLGAGNHYWLGFSSWAPVQGWCPRTCERTAANHPSLRSLLEP